jgi:hypothetical protein
MPFRPPFSPLRAPRVFRISAPSPTKKLLKGDSYWATHHIVLGWLVDTVRLTIEPPSLTPRRTPPSTPGLSRAVPEAH